MAETTIAERLRKLEEKLKHEFLGVEERVELEDLVRKLRKRATIETGRA